jgi:transposase
MEVTMARKANFTESEITKAHQIRDQAKTALELRKALSVLLVSEGGLDTNTTAKILKISERTVFRNQEYLRNQEKHVQNTWGGRRRYTMTVEEEREFLREWEAKATEGGVLSVPPIHAALLEKLGRSIPISTTYRLLARHGWRKVQPDTKHPKSDSKVQEEFKKNSRRWWQPPV